MKQLLQIVFLLIPAILFSQEYVPTQEQLQKFLKTKTYVVKDQDPFSDYNAGLEQAMQYWTVTPYEIIDYKQFVSMKPGPDKSVIMPIIIYPEKHKDVQYEFMAVLLMDKTKRVNVMPKIAAVPLAYHSGEQPSYYYKMPAFVKFLQNHIHIVQQHPELNSKNIVKFYNRNLKRLSNKTIIFTPEQLDYEVATEEQIAQYYQGRVKIMDESELIKLIENNDTTIVFAHVVAPPEEEIKPYSKCYKFLMDVNGNLYYYSWHKMDYKRGGTFLKDDFIKMQRKNFKN